VESDLPTWFAELAAEWRGWEGERSWDAYEGGLALTCSHDGAGHVPLRVRLAEANSRAWRAEATVVLEAGQLEDAARAVADFFG
jgi:hypothetical protein